MERTVREDSRRIVPRDRNGRPDRQLADEVPISELFTRMTSDASLLVRQEIDLAKAELRESLAQLKEMTIRLVIAAALAIPGAMAITAFVVIALGDAINSYWASALIVGVVLLGVAMAVARQGLSKASKAAVGLQRTAASLGEDVRFGKEELRAFRRELTA